MKAKSWMMILSAVLLLALAGCKTVPANTNSDGIVGTWKDAYGLTEYQFETGGTMKIEALDLGSFKGTYHIEDGKITIEYSVVVKKVKDTYTLKLDGNKMYLNDQEFTRKK
nr:DUF5640 domain-containing protein [uncultured Caproiciproducens sp.]